MKSGNALLWVGALAAAMVVAGPVYYESTRPDPRVARVFAAREEAWQRCKTGKQSFNVPRLGKDIGQIDATDCPEAFRADWSAYQEAWRKYAYRKYHASDGAVLGAAAALVLGHPHLALGALKTGKDIPISTRDAWQKVEKSGVIFNCRPTGEMPDI